MVACLNFEADFIVQVMQKITGQPMVAPTLLY